MLRISETSHIYRKHHVGNSTAARRLATLQAAAAKTSWAGEEFEGILLESLHVIEIVEV